MEDRPPLLPLRLTMDAANAVEQKACTGETRQLGSWAAVMHLIFLFLKVFPYKLNCNILYHSLSFCGLGLLKLVYTN